MQHVSFKMPLPASTVQFGAHRRRGRNSTPAAIVDNYDRLLSTANQNLMEAVTRSDLLALHCALLDGAQINRPVQGKLAILEACRQHNIGSMIGLLQWGALPTLGESKGGSDKTALGHLQLWTPPGQANLSLADFITASSGWTQAQWKTYNSQHRALHEWLLPEEKEEKIPLFAKFPPACYYDSFEPVTYPTRPSLPVRLDLKAQTWDTCPLQALREQAIQMAGLRQAVSQKNPAAAQAFMRLGFLSLETLKPVQLITLYQVQAYHHLENHRPWLQTLLQKPVSYVQLIQLALHLMTADMQRGEFLPEIKASHFTVPLEIYNAEDDSKRVHRQKTHAFLHKSDIALVNGFIALESQRQSLADDIVSLEALNAEITNKSKDLNHQKPQVTFELSQWHQHLNQRHQDLIQVHQELTEMAASLEAQHAILEMETTFAQQDQLAMETAQDIRIKIPKPPPDFKHPMSDLFSHLAECRAKMEFMSQHPII